MGGGTIFEIRIELIDLGLLGKWSATFPYLETYRGKNVGHLLTTTFSI